MKIAYILPHSLQVAGYTSVDITSFVRYCHNYGKAAQLVGMEPILYYLSNDTKKVMQFTHKYGFKMKEIPVNLNLRGGRYGWEYSYTLLREISKDDIDLVNFFGYSMNLILPDMYDILALYCKKINKYPLISYYGGGETFKSLRRLALAPRLWLKRLTLNLSDKLFTQSKAELFSLKNDFKIKEDKLVYFNNPIDLTNFYEMPKEIVATSINKDPTKKYVLFAGKLNRGKGVQHIINIMPKIIKIYPDVVFLIAGDGPLRDELYRSVINKDLQKYVSFEGLIPNDMLRFYYNLTDVFVLPSYSEGTPNVMQEALACNTPSVGTNVGGIPDILSDGVGLLVSPKDEDELFNAIKKILSGNFEINQVKRKRLLHERSMENVGRELKKIYEEILNNSA